MATAGPGSAIEAPPLSAPTNGLLRAAPIIERTDDRWLAGIAWDPQACPVGELAEICDVSDYDTSAAARQGVRRASPFLARAYDKCSAFGFQEAGYESRAIQALQAIESSLVEEELWTGTLISTNPHLAATETAGVNEVQTVTVTADGGTFTLTFDGQTTSALDFDATGAEVEAALKALSNIGVADVAVSGDGPYEITFQGNFEGEDVAALTSTATGLWTGSGTAVVATDTEGDPGGPTDEVQTVTITAGYGTFTLTYDGQTTAAIAENAAAATVQSALVALSNLAPGDVVVTGSAGGPYTVTFGGTLAATDVDEMTADDAELHASGGTADVTTDDEGVGFVNGADVVTSGAVTPTRAFVLLEQALADGKCGSGMIHARPLVVALWKEANLLTERNGQFFTPTGHRVVAGSGYPGTGPDGEEVTASSEWAYATDLIGVIRSPSIEVPARDIRNALDRTTNEVVMVAQRPYALQWSQCCWFAAEIDPTP